MTDIAAMTTVNILGWLLVASFFVRQWWQKRVPAGKIEKARIVRVGYVDLNPDGTPHIHGWHMDGEGRDVHALTFTKNQTYFCGYSVDELREISLRRNEWPSEWEEVA